MNKLTVLHGLAVAALLGGCTSRANQIPANIHHAVFISLHDPSEAASLTAESRELGNIPGVAAWAVGKPVDIGRANIDTSYDVGLYVAFRSVEDYRVYLSHPIHDRLVTKWRPRWKSILIRDFGGS